MLVLQESKKYGWSNLVNITFNFNIYHYFTNLALFMFYFMEYFLLIMFVFCLLRQTYFFFLPYMFYISFRTSNYSAINHI